MNYRNLYQLFREQTDRYRGENVFFTRSGEGWRPHTWDEFGDSVLDFACALADRGLASGASVAILAGNTPEWTIADLGSIVAGGVGVGIYPTSSPEQCAFIIEHSDAEFVVVSAALAAKISALPMPKVRAVITVGGDAVPTAVAETVTWADFLASGRAARASKLSGVESEAANAGPDATAIMVYTSGTTGNPKGAMLSHRYILNSVESLRRSVPIFHEDVSFSYLPGCHVAERISGIYNRLYNGTPAYFVDDLSRLYDYMLEVRPTVFASLPRFFEKIHASVVSRFGADAPAEALRDAFGGRIRLLTSGGAPLPAEIADFFARRGLPILQAYGLTENICGAFNTVAHNRYGTVGRAMPMTEIRIAADGEILLRSPMMFSGYYKEPGKTAEMFDGEGWLKTGDLGALDGDGYLTITGRKKEIIVLSNGKNVAPAPIENLVKENHIVSHCFVYGDGRSFCVALITLNAAEAEAFARANGVETSGPVELAAHPLITGSVRDSVERANSRVSGPEQIKRFRILEHDLSLEAGEITPTMKIRRETVASNFSAEIAKLYENRPE